MKWNFVVVFGITTVGSKPATVVGIPESEGVLLCKIDSDARKGG